MCTGQALEGGRQLTPQTHPQQEQRARRMRRVREGTRSGRAPPAAARPLVLVVDDDPHIAAVVAVIVEDAGFRPLVAPDGRRALALVRTTWPRLVITDLMMPQLDGAGLAAALRTAAATRGLPMPPVIVMTATRHHSAQELGVDALVLKPFDLEQVDQLVGQLVPPLAPLAPLP
jgi:CheY-like chemotaxis protein